MENNNSISELWTSATAWDDGTTSPWDDDPTTTLNHNDTNTTDISALPYFWEYKLSLDVQAYAGIFIVAFGLIGNALVISVLITKGHINSTSVYLINLAASDLTICIIGQLCRVFPRALTGIDTGSLNPWWCKSWFFINHSAKTISAWTLVAVTIERCLVVYFPLKTQTFCKTSSAKIASFFINILCSVWYIHYFWSYGAIYDVVNGQRVVVAGCTVLKNVPALKMYMAEIRPMQDFVVRSAGPFVVLLVCNILIIYRLMRQQTKRSNMAGSNTTDKDNSQIRSVTVMLLTVSFAHLICISPMQIMYLIDKSDPFGWEMRYRWQAVVALRWSFAIDIYYANHAINFILYCISGRDFRENLKNMLAKMCVFKLCFASPAKPNRSLSVSVEAVDAKV